MTQLLVYLLTVVMVIHTLGVFRGCLSYNLQAIVCLQFQVDMAKRLYLLSLVLMLFLLSRILAQKLRGSYKEKVREKMTERHEQKEQREEKKEAIGWRRRKRSIHGI